MEKEHRLSVRVPKELKEALARAEKTTRVDQANLIRACVEALLEYVEEHGEITMPLVVKPKSKEEADKSRRWPEPREQFSTMEERPEPPKPAKPRKPKAA